MRSFSNGPAAAVDNPTARHVENENGVLKMPMHAGVERMPKVTYIAHDGATTTVDVPVGENVMRGALYNNVDGIVGECGGALSCATCHCYVDEAWSGKVGGPTTHEETDLLEAAASEVKPSSRLSCQIEMTDALDGLVVHLPEAQF
jgi:2Fe-2S ferredoxin